MSFNYEFQAELRQNVGKGASRRLRRLDDRVPAIVYGCDEAPVSISLEHNKVLKALEHESFFSHILTLHIAGKPTKAILRDLQRHPYKPQVLHLDFLRISQTEALVVTVPLHFINESNAPGMKAGGLMHHDQNNVEIKCLPQHLPEFIEIDLGNLGVDESIHLSQVKAPAGVEFVALSHNNDVTLASIHMPRAHEEEPTAAPEASAVPASQVKDDTDASAKADKKS